LTLTTPPAPASRHPYERLTPHGVLAALEAVGLRGDGRLLQLNSYENRVYLVHLEDGRPVVAKFYRPGRWTDAQILEEHAYSLELQAEEVPVVAPVPLPGGATLAHHGLDGQDFRYAVYPRCAGHGPELDDPQVLQWLGRFIARLHQVGERTAFAHRRMLTPRTWGHDAVARVLALDMIDPAQRPGWEAACRAALQRVDAAFEQMQPLVQLRLHGDCHPGNLLWRADGPHAVDLDDACTGPAVQDLWMLLSGTREAMATQLAHVLDGYRALRPFDARELALVEPLRTLRMIHHSAWLAERWTDPAFPAAFPWFGTPSYWGQQAQQMREQIEAMDEPPLACAPTASA
jgi:Ser/Thr protein kinase RdoA (MazF antagonist)